jgi:octaprenyl-diphosphate synthase
VSKKASSIKELAPVYELVAKDFQAVNELIPRQLTSEVALVEEIGGYIVNSGGKRLRPLMVLLAAGALGYRGRHHVELAAVIEFLHTATLLHDDVVDHSGMRRGKLTANKKWGNAPSVLVGDFLYSRAFQLMVDMGSLGVMRILSDATNTIAEGEVLQLANLGNPELSESDYREVIRCKTALLFEAATHTAALLAQEASTSVSDAQLMALRDFGTHFGMAYQLVDDWLDYAGNAETMGKNAGDDLAEGKLTLPLIHALQSASAADRAAVHEAISTRNADSEQLRTVRAIVRHSGALEYTHAAATAACADAMHCLDALPAGPYTYAMRTVTEFSSSRLF